MSIASYIAHGQKRWMVDFYLPAPNGIRRVIKKCIPSRELAQAFVHKAQVEAFEQRYFDKNKENTLHYY